ncbi:hypothetical protein B0H14DRAFT_2411478, partial [Mycena olivaceomarginata]
EDTAWLGVEDSSILREIVAALRGRGTKCSLQKLDAADLRMAKATELSHNGPEADLPATIQTDIPLAFRLNRMKLAKSSQRTFYRAIKARRRAPERMKTKIMLDITRHAAAILACKTPKDSEIWQSLNHRDITRTTRAFLWRCMHQAYKIGLACGFADVDDAKGKRDRGANRLYRIMISETAHLIWKLRCIRVIERGSDPTKYFTEQKSTIGGYPA